MPAQLAGAPRLIAGLLTIVALLVPAAASSTVVGKGAGSWSDGSLGGVTLVFGLCFGRNGPSLSACRPSVTFG